MKKTVIFFSVLTLLMLTATIAPVLALGPINAAEVGGNPNLSLLGDNVALDNPSGSRLTWDEDSKSHWLDASEAKGVMNNAVEADINTLLVMGAGTGEFENKWIYLSGENYGKTWDSPTDVPDRGSHGMFYWMLRFLGFPHSYALSIALTRAPNGFYLMVNHVGQK